MEKKEKQTKLERLKRLLDDTEKQIKKLERQKAQRGLYKKAKEVIGNYYRLNNSYIPSSKSWYVYAVVRDVKLEDSTVYTILDTYEKNINNEVFIKLNSRHLDSVSPMHCWSSISKEMFEEGRNEVLNSLSERVEPLQKTERSIGWLVEEIMKGSVEKNRNRQEQELIRRGEFRDRTERLVRNLMVEELDKAREEGYKKGRDKIDKSTPEQKEEWVEKPWELIDVYRDSKDINSELEGIEEVNQYVKQLLEERECRAREEGYQKGWEDGSKGKVFEKIEVETEVTFKDLRDVIEGREDAGEFLSKLTTK